MENRRRRKPCVFNNEVEGVPVNPGGESRHERVQGAKFPQGKAKRQEKKMKT